MGKITGVEWFGSETTKAWRQKELSMQIEAKQPGRNIGGGGGGRQNISSNVTSHYLFSQSFHIQIYFFLSFFLFSVYIQ